MPTTFDIPSRRETRCEPCEFHKLVAAMCVRSGHGGYREYACTHPDAYPKGEAVPSRVAAIAAEVDAVVRRNGRPIGKTEVQPQWCPLKRKDDLRWED